MTKGVHISIDGQALEGGLPWPAMACYGMACISGRITESQEKVEKVEKGKGKR